jgi:hypothetical protein
MLDIARQHCQNSPASGCPEFSVILIKNSLSNLLFEDPVDGIV